MKLTVAFLVLIVASATLANEQALPDNFFDRVEAIIKWFDIRMPVYQKANTLLKQLTRKVNALPPFRNDVDIYYNRWVSSGQDELGSEMQLILGRTAAANGTSKSRASELLKDMLNEQEVKHVLTMMPEVRDAFRKMVLQ